MARRGGMWAGPFLIYFLFSGDGDVVFGARSPSAVNQRLICPRPSSLPGFCSLPKHQRSDGAWWKIFANWQVFYSQISRSFISHFRRSLDNEVDRGCRDRPVIPPPRPPSPPATLPDFAAAAWPSRRLSPLIFICHFANEISASNLRRVAVLAPFPGNSQLRALWEETRVPPRLAAYYFRR